MSGAYQQSPLLGVDQAVEMRLDFQKVLDRLVIQPLEASKGLRWRTARRLGPLLGSLGNYHTFYMGFLFSLFLTFRIFLCSHGRQFVLVEHKLVQIFDK